MVHIPGDKFSKEILFGILCFVLTVGDGRATDELIEGGGTDEPLVHIAAAAANIAQMHTPGFREGNLLKSIALGEGDGNNDPLTIAREILEITIFNLNELKDISTEFLARVHKAYDSAYIDLTFRDYCGLKMSRVEEILNSTNSKGVFIFGGVSENPKVVDLSLLEPPAPDATTESALTTYFTGTSGGHTVNKNDNVLKYGCSADINAIRDLIFFLKKGTSIIPDGIYDSHATIALSTMQDGIPEISKSLGQIHFEQKQLKIFNIGR